MDSIPDISFINNPIVAALSLLVPIVSIVAPFFFVFFIMKLRNDRETLLIEKGLYQPLTLREKYRRFYLSGIISLTIGIALFVGLLPIGMIPNVKSSGLPFLGPWLIPGLILSILGLGLIIFARTGFNKEELEEKSKK